MQEALQELGIERIYAGREGGMRQDMTDIGLNQKPSHKKCV
jgi:hypothetical protein